MTQREQKNSEDYERVRSRPQPRDDHGRYAGDGASTLVAQLANSSGPAGDSKGSAVDWDFIEKREELRLDAYPIPNRKQSGITIGIGFDIGQWSEASFDRLALKPGDKDTLKELFRPFFGKTGEEARAALEAYRRDNKKVPRVTEDQAKDLLKAAGTLIYDQVRSRYNRDLQTSRAENLPRFEDLPREAQTAIMSMAYQYGPDLRRRTPRYWDIIVRQDWPAAIEELRDFHDKDPRRREKEAERFELMLRRLNGSGR